MAVLVMCGFLMCRLLMSTGLCRLCAGNKQYRGPLCPHGFSFALHSETYPAVIHCHYIGVVIDLDLSIDRLVEFHRLVLRVSSTKEAGSQGPMQYLYSISPAAVCPRPLWRSLAPVPARSKRLRAASRDYFWVLNDHKLKLEF